MKILSGGQTGVDRAALDSAIGFSLPCGGWCPKGRIAEDGIIPSHYPLQETPSADYSQRTRYNVRDSDGTLVLSFGKPTGGTQLTIEVAQTLKKPLLVVDLEKLTSTEAALDWLKLAQIKTLNIAGPRESLKPGHIYSTATTFLRPIFEKVLGFL